MRSVQTPPRLDIELDGATLSDADAAALSSVQVNQKLSLPNQCEIHFYEPVGPLAEGRRPHLGDEIRIFVVGQSEPLFEGEVTAIEYTYGPDRRRNIVVRGYDKLQRLRKRQNIATHASYSIEEMVSAIVGKDLAGVVDHCKGSHPDAFDSGQELRLLQNTASDFEWLRRLCHRAGRYFLVREDCLHMISLEGMGDPVPLRVGDNALEVNVEVNAHWECGAVLTEGWDPIQTAPVRGRAHRHALGREIPYPLEPKEGVTLSELRIVNATASNVFQADAIAQRELDFRSASRTTVSGVCLGDTRLHPGRLVDLAGVAEAICGTYMLTRVAHSLDRERGFITEIDTSPPRDPAPEKEPAFLIGVVCDVDDPERAGRVRVSLPSMGGIETDWMRVLSPGGGNAKGFVSIPSVQDQVLILTAHGDPAQGVVLGGLFGENGPFDSGVQGERVLRHTWRTAAGQQILLDDKQGVLRIENQNGSYLELGPDLVMVHAAGDLTLGAPGNKVTIVGDKVDFKRG